MDAISYSLAAKQEKRIKRFIANPDSDAGIVTIPKVIPSGETITIPEGRLAILPNVQVDGELNINGEVFVPSGANFSDLGNQISLKTGFKNRIINGDFSVWQRGTSFPVPGVTFGYTADRMKTANGTDGKFTVSKSSFLNKNSIKFNIDTPPSDLSSKKDLDGLLYRFEGHHLYDLAINHKNITISFWFNSNVIGKYSISLTNYTDSSKAQSYVTTFNYKTANIPQKIEVTIPLNADWTVLNNDNKTSFDLFIGMINQGKFVASKTDTWISGDYTTAPSVVNWGAKQNNFFEIAELQLEEGDVATKFEYVPYDIQLMRCMRYCEVIEKGITTSLVNGENANSWGTSFISFKIKKRVTPSVNSVNFMFGTQNLGTQNSSYQMVSNPTINGVYFEIKNGPDHYQDADVGSSLDPIIADAEI